MVWRVARRMNHPPMDVRRWPLVDVVTANAMLDVDDAAALDAREE